MGVSSILAVSIATIISRAAVANAQQLTCSTWLLGDRFDEVYPHHGHIDVLWETIWRPACINQIYPMWEGDVTDFDPIFANLTAQNITTGYDPNYTRAFLATGEDLVSRAQEAEDNNDIQTASDLYARAAAVYRISRFPFIISDIQQHAWNLQKDAFFQGAQYLEPPMHDIRIPHTHAANGDGAQIPVVRRDANATEPRPVVLLITGLDEYRPDMRSLTQLFADYGWHTLVAEMPGSADCPANRTDPESPDRLWSSILDWADQQPEYDMSRFGAWGLSTGSYYGIRLAHTHPERVRAVAAQGSAVHKMFEPEWIEHSDDHEYAFAITPALIAKWGYDTVADYKANGMRDWSLVENGILNSTATQLLTINGIGDGTFPAEDTLIPLDFGTPNFARVVIGQDHMGGAEGYQLALEWLQSHV